ncbi:MAG: hypothetical protein A2126_02825 [Candidatus Woykebacteria bacterium GWB1_45_5]|uniref:Prenyltransferase n=2 Tax=Candidatus Woykeibacteriota TaxID=1817899 RepID=A0A1G1W031_9BACT|nr:MAG: hypothetical protein A2113_01465 [Candidatus Woykebacteria bacterium GWA1_44_8]OGY24751.1 MAG: hypothetical protein A2126_02825 [Candidatus Woykebacteria bacterium GWB1_45_5]
MQDRGQFLKRFFTYLGERFSLQQFIPLSLIFGIHASLFAQFFLHNNYKLSIAILSSLALFLFLFRLRLFDEFKDYEHDRRHYTTRPVPRGLISLSELRILTFTVLTFEVILSLYLGIVPFVFFVIASLYSLLLFKEFFIRDWLREHFTVYIAVHEVLTIPLFYYLYSINIKNFNFLSNNIFLAHSILLMTSFFSLEVARKIRPKELEIPSKDTYTAQYGISGTSKLLLGLAIISFILSIFILLTINNLTFILLIPVLVGLLFLAVAINKFQKGPDINTSKKVLLWTIIYTVLLNIGLISSLWVAK